MPVVPGRDAGRQSDAALRGRAERDRLSRADEAVGRRRRQRHEESCATPGEAADAISAARREALAAFGDGTLYVERLIERPRHVEIQVFADAHGNVVHLFERECSVQRRHQKVDRGSPSPALTPRCAQRMGEAAVAAARAAGYRNAGTVEFLLEGDGDDARVLLPRDEHAAAGRASGDRTVAGVDLVRAQLRSRRASRCRGRRKARRSAATRSSAASTPRIRRGISCRRPGTLLLLPRAARPGMRVDCRRHRRRRGSVLLRSDARQADRARRDRDGRPSPARSPRSALHRARDPDQHSLPHRGPETAF